MSESEEHELGALDSDLELDDDEESGLNKHERRKYLGKKRRRDGLDSRIAGTAGMATSSKDEINDADKTVVRRLLANGGLILMWYFFSLAISIVSPYMPGPEQLATNDYYLVQQDDVLRRSHRLPLPTIRNLSTHVGSILSSIDYPPHISFLAAIFAAPDNHTRRLSTPEATGHASVLFYPPYSYWDDHLS